MRRKLRVLVAEDNATDLQLLRQAVKRDGVEVELHDVKDGEEVTEYLSREGKFRDRNKHPFPDLLVLDLKMPMMDGLEVLHWLNGRREFKRLPVVMLSGSGLTKDVETAYAEGVSTYFAKPSDFQKFGRLIRTLVEYWSLSELPEKPK
jgi:CheY-like chemotaxis protein